MTQQKLLIEEQNNIQSIHKLIEDQNMLFMS